MFILSFRFYHLGCNPSDTFKLFPALDEKKVINLENCKIYTEQQNIINEWNKLS